MSDSVPQRPKPRPRPRPAKSNPQSSSTGTAGSSTGTQSSPAINDSDDPFVINRGRTKEIWRKLDEINKVTARAASGSDSDGDGNGEPSTPSWKRAKKGATPGKWEKTQDALRILSADLSDDSDSDVELLSGPNTLDKGKTNASPKKRKRQKGSLKSPSITPPPEVPAAILMNARNVIRRALENPRRAPSPIVIDDPEDFTDMIELDPELARIANDIKSQTMSGQSIPKPPTDSETLVVTVKWQKHPLNAGEKESIFMYRIPRDESFRELFEATAEDAQVMAQSLVISHRNKRVFPSTTPSALGIWGEVEFVGCHQNTWEYLRKQALESHQNPIQGKPTDEDNIINIPDDDDDNPVYPTDTAPPRVNHASDGESESEGGKFKLVVRSNKNPKDITLIVRPTTKCGAIVRAFLKKAGLAEQYPQVFAEGGDLPKGKKGRGTKAQVLPDPRLSVDGDKMENDTEIGEADLDDGDMVEVVGL